MRNVVSAVEDFLLLTEIEVRPAQAEVRPSRLEAFDRFGKGRHPAALKFGDCFAYACARFAGAPLLYKGDDFPQTDIETRLDRRYPRLRLRRGCRCRSPT